jgi:hypothetical protein
VLRIHDILGWIRIRIRNTGFNNMKCFCVPEVVTFSVADQGCLFRIRIFSIPNPNLNLKNLSILTRTIVFKLSEIWSGVFIPPDLDPDFYPSRIQGSKRHRIQGPDPQHWKYSTFSFWQSPAAGWASREWMGNRHRAAHRHGGREGGGGGYHTGRQQVPGGEQGDPTKRRRWCEGRGSGECRERVQGAFKLVLNNLRNIFWNELFRMLIHCSYSST